MLARAQVQVQAPAGHSHPRRARPCCLCSRRQTRIRGPSGLIHQILWCVWCNQRASCLSATTSASVASLGVAGLGTVGDHVWWVQFPEPAFRELSSFHVRHDSVGFSAYRWVASRVKLWVRVADHVWRVPENAANYCYLNSVVHCLLFVAAALLSGRACGGHFFSLLSILC